MEIYNYFEKRISKLSIDYKIKRNHIEFIFNKNGYKSIASYENVEDDLRKFIDFIYSELTREFESVYDEDDLKTFCDELNEHLEIIEMNLQAVDYIDLHAAKYTKTKSAKNI